MTLQQLKYALTIARSGSINEAAKQLFISQPSLSETIRELESEVGFDIFLRSNRGIVITPEGEEFLSYAHRNDICVALNNSCCICNAFSFRCR